MNYLAHGLLAARTDDRAPFVLGAMLPDLEWLVAPSSVRPVSERATAGVAHHLAVDATFHRLPAFADLVLQQTMALRSVGVRKGPARAAAHVGVELLLDCWLERQSHLRSASDAVRSALRGGIPTRHFELLSPGEGARLSRVLGDLSERRRLSGSPDPVAVADRIRRVLERRPRLRCEPEETARLAVWARGLAAGADDWAPPLWTPVDHGAREASRC